MSYNFNAVEVFRIAVQIEENGKQFYEKSLEVIKDPQVKALFEDLAQQEVQHKAKFESLKSQLPASASTSTVWDPDNDTDRYIKMMADQHVFVANSGESLLGQVKDVKSALKLAIEFEKDSVIFFLTLEDATDTQKGKEFIRSLVKEEQEHLRRLTMELRRVGR